MFRGVLIAGLNLDLEYQYQTADHKAVIRVRRTAGFRRIVAHDSAFLFAIQRLDRRVGVQDPGFAQQGASGVIELFAQPVDAGLVSIFSNARRIASSLSTRLMPSSGGLTVSARNAVMWA